MEKSMIKFDTVRFSTSSNNIQLLEKGRELFVSQVNESTGEVKSILFNSNASPECWNSVPFSLYIRANQQSNRMTIEFSSKLLLEDYPLLISATTFGQCLRNIERLGFCQLDIDAIYKDCEFNKLHITKDIEMDFTETTLNTLNRYTSDYRRFGWKRYENDSISFKKDVKSKDCQEELIIYNKEKEILTHKNKPFLSMVSNAAQIKEYFKGKVRFEVKLANKRKIMHSLNIADTSFNSVMSANPNAVLAQFNKIFATSDNSRYPNPAASFNRFKDFAMRCIIRCYNGDMRKIEQDIKDFGIYKQTSRNARNRKMKEIARLLKDLNNQGMNSDAIIDEIRNKLDSHSLVLDGHLQIPKNNRKHEYNVNTYNLTKKITI